MPKKLIVNSCFECPNHTAIVRSSFDIIKDDLNQSWCRELQKYLKVNNNEIHIECPLDDE